MDLTPQFMAIFAVLRRDELVARRAHVPVFDRLETVRQQLADRIEAAENDAMIPARFGLVFVGALQERLYFYNVVIREVESRGEKEDDDVMRAAHFVLDQLIRVANNLEVQSDVEVADEGDGN